MNFRIPALTALLALLAAMGPLACAHAPGPGPAGSIAGSISGGGPEYNFDPKLAEAYYRYLAGETRLNEGDLDGAMKDFEQAIVLAPKEAQLKGEMTQLYLRRGDLPEALKWAKGAVEENPRDTQARFVLAGILSGLNMDEEAIAEYEKVRAADPTNRDTLLLLGALHGRQREYRQAVEALSALVKIAPDSFMGYYYLGRVSLEMDDLAAAEKNYLKAVEIKPLFENALLDLAYVYERENKANKAVEVYGRILAANPTNRTARSRLGRLYLIENRYDDALAQFEEMKRLGQYDDDARIKVGLIYLEQKKTDLALKEFEQVLSDDPANDHVQYYLGTCYEDKGAWADAQKRYALVPDSSDVYLDAQVHLAYVLQKQDKLAEAEAAVRQAMTKLPNEPRLLLFLGALLEAQSRYDEALKVLGDGLALAPKNAEFVFRIGVVLDKKGDTNGCIERMKEAISLDAGHANALNYLGYTYADKGIHLQEAEGLVKRALALRPGDGFVTDSLGWVYYKQKRYKEALSTMQKATSLAKDDPTITEHLGDVYFALGQGEQALAAYKRAIELGHDDKAAVQAKISRLEQSQNRRKADAPQPCQAN